MWLRRLKVEDRSVGQEEEEEEEGGEGGGHSKIKTQTLCGEGGGGGGGRGGGGGICRRAWGEGRRSIVRSPLAGELFSLTR